MEAETFYTVEEVSEALRISKMTVYRLLDQQELSYIRIGRSFRIPAVAVTEYIRVNTHRAMLRLWGGYYTPGGSST